MHVGPMVWEMGARSVLEQFAWAAAMGFEAVGFHTSPLLAPRRAIDPETMTPADWARLRAATEPFEEVDIHAPFDNYDLSLCTPNERVREASVAVVELSLQMAGRLGAQTVTVHPTVTRSGIDDGERIRLLAESLLELDETAAALGVRIGLETTADFGLFGRMAFEATGVTVDIGHLSFHDGAAYRPWGTLGGLIRHLGPRIVHVHLHDYDGQRDHLPLGAGRIDFTEVIDALKAIGYHGSLCLELAPSPAIEDDYVRSRELLRALIG